MSVLSHAEIASHLKSRPNWVVEGGELVRTFKFETFPEAIAFVNKVAEIAEEANHHPDIDIRYNKVRLALVSHDAGGLTSNDFALAAGADRVA
ncbi:MAG: 4a-hydroxytetrahydrobiopterin dehydratase [Terracidiphilus sp.]|jgi:4a-hydroxytetrahydrobiopterin dehydratase